MNPYNTDRCLCQCYDTKLVDMLRFGKLRVELCIDKQAIRFPNSQLTFNRGCEERFICVMRYFPAFGIQTVAVAAIY